MAGGSAGRGAAHWRGLEVGEGFAGSRPAGQSRGGGDVPEPVPAKSRRRLAREDGGAQPDDVRGDVDVLAELRGSKAEGSIDEAQPPRVGPPSLHGRLPHPLRPEADARKATGISSGLRCQAASSNA